MPSQPSQVGAGAGLTAATPFPVQLGLPVLGVVVEEKAAEAMVAVARPSRPSSRCWPLPGTTPLLLQPHCRIQPATLRLVPPETTEERAGLAAAVGMAVVAAAGMAPAVPGVPLSRAWTATGTLHFPCSTTDLPEWQPASRRPPTTEWSVAAACDGPDLRVAWVPGAVGAGGWCDDGRPATVLRPVHAYRPALGSFLWDAGDDGLSAPGSASGAHCLFPRACPATASPTRTTATLDVTLVPPDLAPRGGAAAQPVAALASRLWLALQVGLRGSSGCRCSRGAAAAAAAAAAATTTTTGDVRLHAADVTGVAAEPVVPMANGQPTGVAVVTQAPIPPELDAVLHSARLRGGSTGTGSGPLASRYSAAAAALPLLQARLQRVALAAAGTTGTGGGVAAVLRLATEVLAPEVLVPVTTLSGGAPLLLDPAGRLAAAHAAAPVDMGDWGAVPAPPPALHMVSGGLLPPVAAPALVAVPDPLPPALTATQRLHLLHAGRAAAWTAAAAALPAPPSQPHDEVHTLEWRRGGTCGTAAAAFPHAHATWAAAAGQQTQHTQQHPHCDTFPPDAPAVVAAGTLLLVPLRDVPGWTAALCAASSLLAGPPPLWVPRRPEELLAPPWVCGASSGPCHWRGIAVVGTELLWQPLRPEAGSVAARLHARRSVLDGTAAALRGSGTVPEACAATTATFRRDAAAATATAATAAAATATAATAAAATATAATAAAATAGAHTGMVGVAGVLPWPPPRTAAALPPWLHVQHLPTNAIIRNVPAAHVVHAPAVFEAGVAAPSEELRLLDAATHPAAGQALCWSALAAACPLCAPLWSRIVLVPSSGPLPSSAALLLAALMERAVYKSVWVAPLGQRLGVEDAGAACSGSSWAPAWGAGWARLGAAADAAWLWEGGAATAAAAGLVADVQWGRMLRPLWRRLGEPRRLRVVWDMMGAGGCDSGGSGSHAAAQRAQMRLAPWWTQLVRAGSHSHTHAASAAATEAPAVAAAATACCMCAAEGDREAECQAATMLHPLDPAIRQLRAPVPQRPRLLLRCCGVQPQRVLCSECAPAWLHVADSRASCWLCRRPPDALLDDAGGAPPPLPPPPLPLQPSKTPAADPPLAWWSCRLRSTSDVGNLTWHAAGTTAGVLEVPAAATPDQSGGSSRCGHNSTSSSGSSSRRSGRKRRRPAAAALVGPTAAAVGAALDWVRTRDAALVEAAAHLLEAATCWLVTAPEQAVPGPANVVEVQVEEGVPAAALQAVVALIARCLAALTATIPRTAPAIAPAAVAKLGAAGELLPVCIVRCCAGEGGELAAALQVAVAPATSFGDDVAVQQWLC